MTSVAMVTPVLHAVSVKCGQVLLSHLLAGATSEEMLTGMLKSLNFSIMLIR